MEKETIVIRKIRDYMLTERTDEVAIEQQFQIALSDGRKISVTCTPTHIEEMIFARRYLAGDLAREELLGKTADMEVTDGASFNLDAVDLEEIFQIARDSFENAGALFNDTGCAHSCALIYKGKTVCCIEDIGRHNALDKVIGFALMHQIPISQSYVFTSGRISADYLQKAIDAGFPMVVSRAAVTANAVELAKEKNITLLGFIRKKTGNLYWEGKVKISENKEKSPSLCGTKDTKMEYKTTGERKDKYSLLLLAGGKSSRMGQNKAELTYKGKTFSESLISKAEKLGIEQIYVSGYQENKKNVQVVWDIYPERGPLGGLHACMKQAKTPFCLVLPVDVPQIPVEVLEELLNFHEKCADKRQPILLEHGDRKEYLIGVYPVEMVDFIEDLIREHPASVHGMLNSWGAEYCPIEIPEWQVENINTQEAYKNLCLDTSNNFSSND